MADNENIRAVLKLCTKFDGRDKASFREYQDKLRVILSLHHSAAAEILRGRQRPARTIIGDDPSSLDTAASLSSWNRANNDLFSILFFTAENSANNTVRRFMGKLRRTEWVMAKQRGQHCYKNMTATQKRHAESSTINSTIRQCSQEMIPKTFCLSWMVTVTA